MGLEEEIKNNNILLFCIKSGLYRVKMKELMGVLPTLFKKLCYVTVNDPYKTLVDSIAPDVNSEIFWIDCVTSEVKTPKPEKNVVFVSSPHALTEISIAVKKVLEKGGMEFFIFDSISAMLVYEKPPNVLKFVHGLVLAFREADLNASFVILGEDVSEEVMKDLAMFVDKVVELG